MLDRPNIGTALQENEIGYNSLWWSLIYDQWSKSGGRSAQRQHELAFYRGQLHDTQGATLEAACGTGSIMLPLLADGFDVFGFDSSSPMLDVLIGKGIDLGIADIAMRISHQDLGDFT